MIIECPKSGCDYATTDMDPALAMQLLTMHDANHQTQTGGGATPKPAPSTEKPKRPTIEAGISLEKWVYFLSRWSRFKRLSNITDDMIPAQLLECTDEELSLDLHRNNGKKLDDMTEDQLLKEIKRLSVRGESELISRVNLRNMCQDHQEDIRHFAARVKGQSALCNYTIKCTSCDAENSYADQEIRDQICTGLADPEIQKDVLAQREQNKTPEELIEFIEDREAGKRSQSALTTAANVSRISEYKRNKNNNQGAVPKNTSNTDICSFCGEKGHGYKAQRYVREKRCPAYSSSCQICGKIGHLTKMCRFKTKPAKETELASIHPQSDVAESNRQADFIGGIKIASMNISISHKEYSELNGWTTTKRNEHPLISVGIEVSEEDYKTFNLTLPKKNFISVSRIAVADTGAMTMVAGKGLMKGLGMEIADLIPVDIELSAANNSMLKILGGIFLNVWGRDKSGRKIATRQLCYIQDNDDKIYLSRSACKSLGLISQKFPSVGDCLHVGVEKSNEIPNKQCSSKSKCTCPKREKPPAKPTTLPYPPTAENLHKLKKWLIERYRSSTFNLCENQDLSLVSGPPLKLNVNPEVTPTAVHTPIPVPIHWHEEVKAQLDRDCKLGVIEPVPWGEPTIWCSRMITVAKSNGSPRRTIDLQALNDASLRQTHHTPPPFHLAMSVPHNTKKTIFDAWNGYHSLAIREEDRHYTTFITPWGRYRYCCAPQGFLASNDGYTRRFDEIISDIKNKVKIVDDTILWEEDVEKSFFQACDFLTLCGNNGITLNPDKFQFAEDEVEFAGFKITPSNVQPSAKYLDAILNFPTPKDITGMRSWFGLVNQSAYAFSMAEKMAPFRELLKPGTKFNWNEGMQELFEKSKEEIVHAVENGVRLFDPMKKTALVTDWSKIGTGFSLMQKHCMCNSDIPTCCREGWKLVFAGSQFNNKAEAKYAPVEGECLAVVKALHKPTVKYFVHGCRDLIIATDHKPLVKLLGNRKLEDIHNPRLLSLKEKTLSYRFRMRYVSGSRNRVPDATSRFPTSMSEPSDDNDEDTLEVEQTAYITAISALSSLECVKSTTWENVQEATANDYTMLELMNTVQGGFKGKYQTLPSHIKPYQRLSRFLTTVDGVVLYKRRIVVPPKLREDILANLHSAHQGVTSMISRADTSVFWPGITSDIHRVRDRCAICNRNAPSQASLPPTPPILPEYPFQSVCADYFTLQGTDYLVTVDRYSNWPSVQRAPKGEATSKKLIAEIKKHCGTFGIPEELSSDGGSQFISKETRDFMQSFGIRSRISSVAFPHSNSRAEIGVKTMKRLLADNTGPGGSLDNDKVLRAILQYRNTPDPTTGLSPAEVIFGRQIRDFTPVLPGCYKPRLEWQEVMQKREEALSKRHVHDHERWSEHTQHLPPLKIGDHVFIQNQTGNHPKKWDKSGVVVEVKQHHQYLV